MWEAKKACIPMRFVRSRGGVGATDGVHRLTEK
jgi:hypothetical protein